MKAIIVTDFAYKGPKRRGRGTGPQGLRATLRYLQYRDERNNHLAQNHNYERWYDRGLGHHYRDIFKACDHLQSKHVLAWTWVLSPDPELMQLIPEDERRDALADLTDSIVEDYYESRDLDTPEYSFVIHRAMTKPENGLEPLEHLHVHVVLPGTTTHGICDRVPVYNNTEKGHDRLFREVGTKHFAETLDDLVGLEWRSLREPEPEAEPERNLSDNYDLDDWFPR